MVRESEDREVSTRGCEIPEETKSNVSNSGFATGNEFGESDFSNRDGTDDDGCKMDDESLARLLEKHLSVWYENSTEQDLYETVADAVLEKDLEIQGEFDVEPPFACSTSSELFLNFDFCSGRRRYNSEGSKQGSDCSGYKKSLSASTSQGEKYRRPSYTCTSFHHKRHYAVRRKGPPNVRKIALGNDSLEERSIRATPNWSETAVNGDHLWSATSASGDFCYVGENDCTKHGPRMKCAACKIIAHTFCIPILVDRMKFFCKPTFRDVGVRQYREQTSIHHHWVHRRSQKGKCKQCGKSFQSKLSFSTKEIVALSCSWCKTAYHNKESCFNIQKIGEECTLGNHQRIIVPPSWIVKLPRKGSFKSSLRKSPKKKQIMKKRSKEKIEKECRTFVIKPIPSASVKPVIVFINPKSGGNQGVKLMQKFQWLLNPRQVFDLTQGGPKIGLEMFKKVLNLRILACGGDGTVGWVLSVLDQIKLHTPPAVGVLPLGTGNDLARALGWGGGYTDEPIGKILSNVAESEVILLDRWELRVEKNTEAEATEEGKENLPLNVVNNYFSLGVDAHIALEFHEAREAHPERFNSRLRNKMFYGQMGGKDLLKRKWKDLSEFVKLECDGKDITPKLKEHKVHAIVFLNIPSYGGGTRPWNRASGAVDPATDDGLIEVIGLTTYQLPLLQAGGHGTSITQCREAKIITTKTIPMQVDGEACRLSPSIIYLSLLNKAPMLVKRKSRQNALSPATLEKLKVFVQKIGMSDYEQHHYDKDLLAQAASEIGVLEVSPGADLEQVRNLINQLIEETNSPKISPDWCFIDSCTAERFFRIDRAQEHLHYVADIASDILFILDPEKYISASDEDLQTPNTASPGSITGADLSTLEKVSDNVIKASKFGNLKLLKTLHGEGNSLLSIDSSGETALHHSARDGHKDVVKYLIASAPSSLLDMTDNIKGRTALHVAAAHKRRSICCLLIAGGASATRRDYDGKTPRLLALEAEDNELAAYLENQEHFKLVSNETETAV